MRITVHHKSPQVLVKVLESRKSAMGYFSRAALIAVIALIGTIELVESSGRSIRSRPRSIANNNRSFLVSQASTRHSRYLAIDPVRSEVKSGATIYEKHKSHLENHSSQSVYAKANRRLPSEKEHENVFARKVHDSKKSSGKGSEKGSKKTSKSSNDSTEAPIPTPPPSPPPTVAPTTPLPTITSTMVTPGLKSGKGTSKKTSKRSSKSSEAPFPTSSPSPPPTATPTTPLPTLTPTTEMPSGKGGSGKGSSKKTSKSSSKSSVVPSPTRAPSPRPTSSPTVPPPTATPTSSPTDAPTIELTEEPTTTYGSKSSKKSGKGSKKAKKGQSSPSPSPAVPSSPTPDPPTPVAPPVVPPTPTAPVPNPPAPTTPIPTLPPVEAPIPPAPTPVETSSPTTGSAPTEMPVPTTPVPTRPPTDGPVVAATPFCAEYTGASGIGTEADSVAAAQETCIHISEYIVESFELNIEEDITGVNCDQSGAASGDPPQICFDLEVTIEPGLSSTPSTGDLDILIAVSLQEPTVQGLYDRLTALPSNNPYSSTTSVVQSEGPLSLSIVALIGQNPTLSSSLVLMGVLVAVLFHRCYGQSRFPTKDNYRSREIRNDPWSMLDRDCHVLFSIDENGEEETFARLTPFKD